MMSRRHLLVVASQCQNMRRLRRLDEAAHSLVDTFLDATGGACDAALPDGRSLLSGELTSGEITEAVEAAIRHASRREATLVLALLGHGFVAGGSTRLYFMGYNSHEQVRLDAVDVQSLLLSAVDHVGVDGVIGVIDTCMAAGAVPPMGDVLAGSRSGRTRLALLLAAGVTQEAYDLRVARGLADVLRSGVPDAGPLLDMGQVLVALRQRAGGQDIAGFGYEGDSLVRTGLWLGHNRLHVVGGARTLVGPLGSVQLNRALRALDPTGIESKCQDAASLQELRRELANGAATPERIRAMRTVEILQVTSSAVAFLRRWMPHALSTATLRRAVAALDYGRVARPVTQQNIDLATEVDFVEYVALRRTGVTDPYQAVLTKFVVALAQGADMELDAPELRDWMGSIGANVYGNDAIAAFQADRAEQRLQLVISLASLTGGWPDVLDVWLLCDGSLSQREEFYCQPDQPGVEAALADAVAWAEDHAADLGLKLRRVDVAVPTELLLCWRPEEVVYGTRLGFDYDVTTRWSQRLFPPAELRWINNHAINRLAQIGAYPPGARVEWLPEQETRELGELHQRLRDGRYACAIGLTYHPGNDARLMDLLLAYTPILLWPQSDAGFPSEKRECVVGCWERLPQEFLVAYRQRWRAQAHEPIADLRAVWDDRDWLEFCRSLRHSRTTSRSA
jgi:hypothetical protein